MVLCSVVKMIGGKLLFLGSLVCMFWRNWWTLVSGLLGWSFSCLWIGLWLILILNWKWLFEISWIRVVVWV